MYIFLPTLLCVYVCFRIFFLIYLFLSTFNNYCKYIYIYIRMWTWVINFSGPTLRKIVNTASLLKLLTSNKWNLIKREDKPIKQRKVRLTHFYQWNKLTTRMSWVRQKPTGWSFWITDLFFSETHGSALSEIIVLRQDLLWDVCCVGGQRVIMFLSGFQFFLLGISVFNGERI